MMQIRCLAIDDEPLALDLIKDYIGRFPALKLLCVFDDAIAGAEFLRSNPVDLLFTDVNMPDITGIEMLRSIPQKPLTIFTTAHKKFAYEGFELDALDYLLKPISFDRFSKAVNKAIDFFQHKHRAASQTTGVLFVRSDYQLLKIETNNIEYIESVEDYLKIHFVNQKPVMTLMTLKAVLERLPADQFKRIHRSYVVSLARIKSISNKKVKLSATELPMSDSYADEINQWIRKQG